MTEAAEIHIHYQRPLTDPERMTILKHASDQFHWAPGQDGMTAYWFAVLGRLSGNALDGYSEALENGGRAFVLAEHHTALREMAVHRLHDPETFWDKLESRISLNALPRKRDEERLLHAMGWETANVHLGSPNAAAIRGDLKRRRKQWLYEAAGRMANAVEDDWRQWRKARG